jgi:hypothetical protein
MVVLVSKLKDPQPPECDCCGFPTAKLTKCDAYARTLGHGPFTPAEDKEWAWLCQVCRSTHVGNMYLYPRNYDHGTALIGRTINYGINAILAAIKAGAG